MSRSASKIAQSRIYVLEWLSLLVSAPSSKLSSQAEEAVAHVLKGTCRETQSDEGL